MSLIYHDECQQHFCGISRGPFSSLHLKQLPGAFVFCLFQHRTTCFLKEVPANYKQVLCLLFSLLNYWAWLRIEFITLSSLWCKHSFLSTNISVMFSEEPLVQPCLLSGHKELQGQVRMQIAFPQEVWLKHELTLGLARGCRSVETVGCLPATWHW